MQADANEIAAAIVKIVASKAKDTAHESVKALGTKISARRDQSNIDAGREMVRTRLTFFVVGFYCFMILLLMALVVFGKIDMSVAKELHATFLTPLTVLAASSLGFYFGVGAYHEISRDRSEQKSELPPNPIEAVLATLTDKTAKKDEEPTQNS